MRKINVEVVVDNPTYFETGTLITFIDTKTATTQGIIDFKGDLGESCVRYYSNNTFINVGLGDTTIDMTNEVKFLKGVKSAIKSAEELERDEVYIFCGNDSYLLDIVSLNAQLALYKWDKYKTKKDDDYIGVTKLIFIIKSESEFAKSIVERNQIVAESVFFARDLQNDNASVVTPYYLARESMELEFRPKFRTQTIHNGAIKEGGLGLLYAVGQDSVNKPYLIIMEYNGAPEDPKISAIVGKGITYDSGGLSLKPSDSMLDMRMDMSGASAVLGFMKYVAETQPKKNFIAVIPAAHNSIGSNSYMVGDVLTAYDGTTVEVRNTDAEGRLVLADALAYLVKNYQPTEIIDLATLTGAVVSALGDTMSALVSNSPKLVKKIYEAGEVCHERVWELPLRDEHRDAMKSDIADLRNMSKIGRNAGSITAGAFLENFVDDIPWCHIDIAGTAMNDKDGGTGYGVQLLIETLL